MSSAPENIEINFTPREQQLVVLLWEGYSYKMIAEQLHIAIGTVKTQINLLHVKTQTNNTGGVLRFAFLHGFNFDIIQQQVFYHGQLVVC